MAFITPTFTAFPDTVSSPPPIMSPSTCTQIGDTDWCSACDRQGCRLVQSGAAGPP
eukprot:CAMPEP_0195575520 /NCGR_PEP_ID=MMETSP0814-20130614/7254_1 /TAXON_ID=97485 /ORGANISM="Prymnesium parvum, Strain Texoma1" /LENGTH=55 /DNA_ID=CAMNT_0040711665 /DNA_START=1 /DNA_END=164 /DNA_ORIENTATION=-